MRATRWKIAASTRTSRWGVKSRVAVDPSPLGEKLASLAGKAQYAQRKWLSAANPN